jgi:hypothetical protein
MKTSLLKIALKNYYQTVISLFILFISIVPTSVNSQEKTAPGYRNINAYLEDFAKNELFVKKSLIDYSASIMEDHAMARASVSSTRIIDKLKKINVILRRFDKGFQNNITLRDGFIRMNEKTIECMTNGTLILNDYELQASKEIGAVKSNLTLRESNLISYFNELKAYEETKRQFGLLFNIAIKTFSGNNVFEYNAHQNILFYKINVIDQKIIASISCINKADFTESMALLDTIYQDAIAKTTELKDDYRDISLNQESIAYSNYIYSQKEVMVPMFNNFIKEYEELQVLKESKTPETSASIAQYNSKVRSYNATKNKLFDYLKAAQVNKMKMCNKWFKVNHSFLVNNIKVENIHESYISAGN